MPFVLIRAAVHQSWVTADLYEQQISIGVIAVTQGCCQPVLQSSPEQQGMPFVLSRAAVHQIWVTADLYQQQISICEIAVTQGCCQPVLLSSPEPEGMLLS